MTWYPLFLAFVTNGIRIFLCLSLVAALLNFPKQRNKVLLFTLGSAAVVTAVSCFGLAPIYPPAIEICLILLTTRYLFGHEMRMSLFLIFFFEIAAALWDFLVSTWLGVFLQSTRFTDVRTIEYALAIVGVRLLMLGIAAFVCQKDLLSRNGVFRLASGVAILGMFGVITLSEQTFLSFPDSVLTTWLILSLMPMVAVLFFNLNRQYEMEKEIVRLKEEQTELLQRDYQTLHHSYSMHAKLFHDLHNHIEILHRFLSQGQTADALHYLDDIYAPAQEMVQTVWTGDEATDYLISNKIARAQAHHVETQINIEFPRHTNIRSADLTAILGNLLDNALDATLQAEGTAHFIHLTIRRIHDMLIIKVENDCGKLSLDSNGTLQTTKSEGTLHGWGLKSARAAAERYDGTIETSCAANVFCAVATLSYKTRQ